MPSRLEQSLCPLCSKNNACAQLEVDNNSPAQTFSCWCQRAEYSFPEFLLNTVPEALRGRACICKACARVFSEENE